MKKCIAILLATASLWLGSAAHAAQFKGKVTTPDGVTPAAGVMVALYKYDSASGQYSYHSNAYTDAAGLYTATAGSTGVYLVNFAGLSSYNPGSSGSLTFYPSSFSETPAEAIYLPETYNDVTALTPTKLPTQFSVTSLTQVVNLALVKLNLRTSGCFVTGPITVNGVPYSNIYPYSGGPAVPDAGGTLNISFKVRNLGATAIATNVQALALLTRRDVADFDDTNSVQPFARKAQTLPAKATTTVSLSVAIPAAIMSATPPGYYLYWAFNLGIQMVTPNGVANCKGIMFPVQHVPPTATVGLQEATALAEPQSPEAIPLTLSADGQIIEWGPAPDAE